VNDGLSVRVDPAPSGKTIEAAHGALLRHQQGPGDAVPGEQPGKGGLVASFGREVAAQESISVELSTAVDAAALQIGPQRHDRQQPETRPRPGVACGEQSARPEHQDGQGEQRGRASRWPCTSTAPKITAISVENGSAQRNRERVRKARPVANAAAVSNASPLHPARS